jgi:hypothetical protein
MGQFQIFLKRELTFRKRGTAGHSAFALLDRARFTLVMERWSEVPDVWSA